MPRGFPLQDTGPGMNELFHDLQVEQEERKSSHVHEWSDWKEIGRTGDWFHPLIVERKCKTCGATETDEH